MSDSIGSVSVEVVPDARGFSEKLSAQLRDQQVEVKANADTEEANAELDKTARTRTAKIKTDVSQLSQGASKLDQFVGNLGLLPALALSAGSALIPLAAAMGGVVAAIGAPLAIAGGGATLFGLLAGAAVAQTNKQLKVIDSLQKKLDGATKGTAAYTQAQKDLRDAQRALTPEQTKFQSNISKMGAAFQNFLGGKSGSQLLSVVNQGIGLLIKLLPLAAPLIASVGDAFSTLLGELSKGAGSKGFSDFIHQLATQVGPDIVTFGHIAGNGIKGITGFLTGLSGAFGGANGGVLHGLEQLSARFADLGAGAGHSQWLKDFVAYFHRVGPQVGDTLAAVARAIGHIVHALAPLGPVVLTLIEGMAKTISAIPIPVLTALAGAFGALVLVQKTGGIKNVATLLGALGAGAKGGGVKGVVGAITDGGVQKVYVVNMGPGGLGGGGAKTAEGALAASALEITAGVASIAVLGAITYHYEKPVLKDTAKSAISSYVQAHSGSNVGGPNNPLSPNSALAFKYPGINYVNASGSLKSTSTAFDALKAHAESASRQIDLIGPHTHQTMSGAIGDVNRFQGVLNSIHDHRFKIIADTASAISNLQHLQALQIADKHFTVYQRNQIIELGHGPGGTRFQSNPGGSAPRTSGGSGGAGTGQTHVHVHLDDGSGRTLHGVVVEGADQVYHANRAYENARAGR